MIGVFDDPTLPLKIILVFKAEGGWHLQAAETRSVAWSNGAPPDRSNLRHAVSVDDDVLTELAGLLAVRNDLDRAIGELIGRPMTAGHPG